MEHCFINLLQSDEKTLVFIATMIMVMSSVITFIITRISSKNRFKHANTLKCIEAFRCIFDNGGLNELNVQNYLGLINEELFYLKHKMVNKNLAKEWIANMINYLPVFYKNKDKIIAFNKEILTERGEFFSCNSRWKLLYAYPRILDVIFIKAPDFDLFKCVDKCAATSILEIEEDYNLKPSKTIEQEYENHTIIEITKEYLALLMLRNLKMREKCSFISVLILNIKIYYSKRKVKVYLKQKHT